MHPDTQTPSLSEILRSYPLRLGIYAMITLGVFQAVFAGLQSRGAAAMGAENGPIETAQLVLLIVAAVAMFAAARWAVVGRVGLVLCGAVLSYAAAREADTLMESLLFQDAYTYVVGLPMAILAVAALVLDRRRLLGDFFWLMKQPAATMFAIAGIYLCFVCQSLDRLDMWSAISQKSELLVTKAFIEEYAELFAYLILAFSGIEGAILVRGMQASADLAEEQTDEAEPEAPLKVYRPAA